jgi:signal transduction histidine kinase
VGGKLRLELEPLDLAELVRDLAERSHWTAGAAQPLVPLNLVVVEDVVGRWDRMRVEQVLTNLISNAIKYGMGRPIDVAMASNQTIATLSVTDHGIGIAPADQARIFDRFERASPANHFGGLGLGLFITRQIVDALGGTIRVASELGKGSTFTVELPLAGPPEARMTETEPMFH